jgi:hypothetical protein
MSCTWRGRPRVEAEFVGFAHDCAGLHAAAGEPHGEGVDVVVAPGGVAVFTHRGAAELAAPDDERVLEQAARFEILHEGGLALVDLAADFLEVALEIFARAAVAVPVGVIQLDETRAALDEAAGEQAVAGEGRLCRVRCRRAGVASLSVERSMSSGALDCMRDAIS